MEIFLRSILFCIEIGGVTVYMAAKHIHQIHLSVTNGLLQQEPKSVFVVQNLQQQRNYFRAASQLTLTE